MTKYHLKIGLIVILILSLLSCSKEKEENYSIERVYLRLMKSASMDEAQNFVRDGFAVYGLMLSDEKHLLNKNPEIIDSLMIKGPDGQEFQKIKTGAPFAISGRTGGSGYQAYGLKEQGIVWAGVDLLLDMKTPPANGKYTFEAILKSGKKLSETLDFEAYRGDPLQGYATGIRFDEKNRTLKWNPSKGQSGYRIGIYQGIKQGRVDASKMVFNSETRETSFVIPDSVEFEAGQSYFFIVDSFFSKTGNYFQSSYIHHQDNDSEIAVYTPADRGAKTEKEKIPLALSDVPYPYPVKYLNANGGKIAYIDEGMGTPILLIHGLSTDLLSFAPLYGDLIKNGYRVIALDLIGYGKSSKPEVNHSIEFYSKIVLDLMKKLSLNKAVLLGHSMGGAIALLVAGKNPQMVKSLVLLTPGGTYYFPSGAASYFRSVYDSQYAKRYSDSNTARAYFKESVFKWNPLMENFMEIRERSMLHPDWKKVQKTIRNSSISFMETNNAIADKIGAIQVPVLAIYCENDSTINARLAEENIRQNAKSWKVKIFKECGHMIQYEQKEKTIMEILDFLGKKK